MIAAVRGVIAGFNLSRIDLEGLRVGIDEHRNRVAEQDGVDGRDERVRRNDYLIARADPERVQSREQRRRAVRGREAVLGPEPLGPCLFEPANTLAAIPATAPDNVDHRVLFGGARYRPRWKRGLADR